MAADAQSVQAPNGTETSNKTVELAVGLPLSPGTRVHLRLDISASSIMLFLASAALDGGQGSTALGSFVYALPDRYNPTQPMSTPLYTLPSSIDFATRMAKVLAQRTKRPCYVGSSINLSSAAGGGSVEEEMHAFRAIVDVVTTGLERAGAASDEP